MGQAFDLLIVVDNPWQLRLTEIMLRELGSRINAIGTGLSIWAISPCFFIHLPDVI